MNALIAQAQANRKDLAALVQQAAAAVDQRKAATDERLPEAFTKALMAKYFTSRAATAAAADACLLYTSRCV